MKSDKLKEAMKESPRRYTNPFLSDEENEKLNLWNNQELEGSNIEKETDLYTDKNVMECELPELLVCYKENAFHVKDICVDEGIPHGERILFDEDNHEILCISSSANEGKNEDVIEDSLHTQFLKPEELRFSPMEDYYMESALCSGTNRKVDTDLPVPEPTNDRMDIGDNCDEVIERNLDIQLLKDEKMRSSSKEDFCMKSDASFGTQEVDSNLAVTGPPDVRRNMVIDTQILVEGLQNSIPDKPYKDNEDDDAKECVTEEEATDSVVSNELKNMSKDDKSGDDGSSKCSPDKLNSSSESDTVPNATDNYGPDISMQTGEKQINSGANLSDNAYPDQVVSNSIPPLQQDQPLPSLKFLLDSIKGAHGIDQRPCQSPVEEVLKRPILGNEGEELVPSAQTTNLSNESTPKGNNNEVATSSGLDGARGPENVRKPSIDNHQELGVQCGEGESSFSVAGPVSGMITYSGPIAFSGSVSIRSDSSTTSTRSFAFPILQTEWNSSPVRMAKADRRRLQKQRGWGLGLLCCRF